MKSKASTMDQDDFKDKDEDEELVEDETRLSSITMDRQDTSREIVRTQ